jgi:hypothetical protein
VGSVCPCASARHNDVCVLALHRTVYTGPATRVPPRGALVEVFKTRMTTSEAPAGQHPHSRAAAAASGDTGFSARPHAPAVPPVPPRL